MLKTLVCCTNLDLKIEFLKPYNLTMSINLSAEAAQLSVRYRHMKVRISEHQDVSPITSKRAKGTLSTSVRADMLICDHKVAWEDLLIIGRESNRYLLETK